MASLFDDNPPSPSPMPAPAPKPVRTYGHSRQQALHQGTSLPESIPDNNRPTIKLIYTKDYSNVSKITEQDHLTDDSWHKWKEHMKYIFINCSITEYINSNIVKPDKYNDPIGVNNWKKNDYWAQQVIIQNVTSSQMNHVRSKKTAKAMYKAFMMTHEYDELGFTQLLHTILRGNNNGSIAMAQNPQFHKWSKHIVI
jgi:hypothetical protein